MKKKPKEIDKDAWKDIVLKSEITRKRCERTSKIIDSKLGFPKKRKNRTKRRKVEDLEDLQF
jgi:hypothetical protein